MYMCDYNCMLTIRLISMFIQLLHVPIRKVNWSVQ